ncbi:MAG: NAD-dependent epimerase/dehydratase family protein [Deltaproteobacteria bacterium]|nr:NAD-dependent epimerase/dehydratase family protein [Deltaproteobacteria bacterium]
MPTPQELHVVLGAGQIGARLARVLVARGHRVRVVQRTAAPPAPGTEHLAGDLTDLGFAAAAGRGARVVYDCMNPPYHAWSRELLALGRGSLHAATTAGAKLVALDCLYMYGRPTGPMAEDAPRAPCSRKGALRVELEALRLEAHRRGDAPVAIGRASDFFGPALPFSGWSERFFQRIFAGKPGECMGDPDQPHSYTFVDDIARALATLGARPEGVGVWHLPTAPAESTRAITRRLGAALGLRAEVARVPRWMLRATGVFSPFMREVVEMTYQWEAPFVIDDRRYVATFGEQATSLDDAVAVTAAWAAARFGNARPTARPAA